VQLFVGEVALLICGARLQQLRRAQKAANGSARYACLMDDSFLDLSSPTITGRHERPLPADTAAANVLR
jgi:hypothetical protein